MSHTNIPLQSYYVYRHVRLDKNKPFYVGIGTKKDVDVFTTHKSEFRRAFSHKYRNQYWKNIVNKTDYDVEILFESNDHKLIKQKEKEFIKLYGRKDLNEGILCNMSDGGLSHGRRSEETLKKMSEAMKGRELSEEWKNNIAKASKRRWKDPEYKKKLSKACTGWKQTEEVKKKISKWHKENGDWSYAETPVLQLCKETGKVLNEFKSMSEAGRQLGISSCHIGCVCKGKRKTTGGFKWKYKNKNN